VTDLFTELKRRNVFRVGIAYVVVAWLIAQVADLVFDNIEAPDWLMPALLFLLAAGFVLVLVFSWAFEMTPEGIKKEKDVDRSQSITPRTGRKLDFFIIGLMAVALAYFVWEARFQAVPEAVTTEAPAPGPVAASAHEGTKEASIAVLPFADMSAEGDQGYFADGISEELLNVLVRVEGLTVASRTSSFAFKGRTSGISEIAEELRVNHVLEGSVRKAGNRVRITAQLIDAATDRHLWSDTFDRELVDIFVIQDEIANAIVSALRSTLDISDNGKAVTVTPDTENLDAYELYLQARALFMARTQLEESIRLFELTVELDPKFARAWEGLGAIYGIVTSWNIRDRDYDALSIVASKKALELNPDLSMPWATMALQESGRAGNYAQALEWYERAINNDPKNSTAYLWRSIAWAELQFIDRALADVASCLEIDPFYENCLRHEAAYVLIKGDRELALELYQQGLERGFSGMAGPLFSVLMERGNRAAVALELWIWEEDRTFPVKSVLDAIEFPEADHTAGLAKIMRWLAANEEDVSNWGGLLLRLQQASALF